VGAGHRRSAAPGAPHDVVFSGFDSAWGRRKNGALCHLGLREDGSLEFLAPPSICGWEEVTQWARATSWQNHVVAVDQSLVVRNATGMRPVERKLARALMREFGCGAHASNTTNPCYGPAGGIWDFVEALESRGYRQDPLAVAEQRAGRFYFECFPHPALLGLFDLGAVLAYKVRHHDRSAWGRLLELLRSLERREPPFGGIGAYAHARLPQTLDNENKLDSVVAAYVAAWWWRHGTRRSVSLGSLSDGYIVTPVSDRTKAAFDRVFAASEMNQRGCAACARPT
jgi:predicted RNase H-like nuclease